MTQPDQREGKRESRIRSVLLVYFPMFIATLSLVTSIYNGYLNSKFVELIERNLGRSAYISSCKDVIDAYFQAKVRITAANASRIRNNGTVGMQERAEAANGIARFAALATYLANLSDEETRARYNDLSRQLESAARTADAGTVTDVQNLLAHADRMFTSMNDDCVKLARRTGL